jgi:hypothetical protein
MKQLIEKLKSLVEEIATKRGRLSLFGLFLREDAGNKWDLVVAAPWINANSFEDIEYIANKLKSYLDDSQLISISRIVLLDLDDQIVKSINQYCNVPHGGLLELNDFSLFNIAVPFKYAYIIISQGDQPVSLNVGEQHLRQNI